MKSLRGITGEQPSLLETEEFYEGDDPTLMNDDETVGEDLALIMEEDATTDEGSILLSEDDDDTTDDEDYVLTKVRRVLFENLCITILPFVSGWFTLNVDNLFIYSKYLQFNKTIYRKYYFSNAVYRRKIVDLLNF